ncbi:modular serine protease [Nasonia vitripennis]|uniref:Uncharacterized protein n=1 Tax=Nasonia vitripennis TaxID=7425 RepID=A0A7M7H737_NASVI|nr:modular serine protease [Nasonia vitripennis]XP_031787381.1 modular serine protease [Nasonia vitripennis]
MNRLAILIALIALIHNGTAQRRPARPDFSRFGETSSGCSSLQFRCKNGQCITSESLCDGLVDCRDGSDETRSECSGPNSLPCNPRTFRCDYGACVDGDALCNGIKNCADNSDEDPEKCRSSGGNNGYQNTTHEVSCRSNQFRCDNGQCIGNTELCDGNVDCTDRSDETVLSCGSFNCPQYVFRCAYGACIDNDLKCNGVVNCADGSDEDRNLCGGYEERTTKRTTRPNDDPYNTNQGRPTDDPYNTSQPRPTSRPTSRPTQRPTSKPPLVRESCDVPDQPENGQWMLEKSQCHSGSNCRVQPGVRTLDPGTQLVYKCNSGYKLNGTSAVFCGLNGKWSRIPKCQEIRCPPLSSASREAQCTYEDNWTSCDSPVLPRTIAQLSCRNSYRQDVTDLTRRDNIKCNAKGEWEPQPIKCVSVCGIASTSTGVPLIVNGTRASVSDFPWHGTLYKAKGNEKQFICGATIIKDNLLVTAAHCVSDEVHKKIERPSTFYVAVGNVFRDYDYEGHDPRTVKKTKVKDIFIICNYLGLEGNYASDIAILQIETAFVFSSIVMPICLDTTSASDQAVLEVGNHGRVPGFGRTAQGSSSFILQAITVPYVPLNTCKSSSIASDSEKYITIDKFCAGYTNGSSVCDGDSGGGLVFKTDNKWYLRGIVSVGIGATKVGAVRTCDSYAYSLYTRVSSHMEWIQDVILRLETNKPFPICS